MTTLECQHRLIKELLPKVERESGLLTPFPQPFINAWSVFDAIRELSDPPMTKEEFNEFCDSL